MVFAVCYEKYAYKKDADEALFEQHYAKQIQEIMYNDSVIKDNYRLIRRADSIIESNFKKIDSNNRKLLQLLKERHNP